MHLRGTVTFFDESLFSRFIQDETAGIYLQFPANVGPPNLAPGQVVEVTGTGSPGEYAPVVVVRTLAVVGQQSLPPAKIVTYAQLASGTEDSQFVEITGIVRSVRTRRRSTATHTGTAPPGAYFVRYQVVFQGDANNSGGSVYFDDLNLTPTGAAPVT